MSGISRLWTFATRLFYEEKKQNKTKNKNNRKKASKVNKIVS